MHCKSMKSLLVVVALAATMALGATSALASSSNPDFPHGDTSGASWTGVSVDAVGSCTPTLISPCTFAAESPASILVHDVAGPVVDCDVAMQVDLYPDGFSSIHDVVVSGPAPCASIVATDDAPWADQVCEYTGSGPHEYWDRIEADFTSPATGRVAGELFGRLSGASATSIGVHSHLDGGPWSIVADGSGVSSPFAFDQTVAVSSTDDPCAWPEMD